MIRTQPGSDEISVLSISLLTTYVDSMRSQDGNVDCKHTRCNHHGSQATAGSNDTSLHVDPGISVLK
jgi:hypothetical protein